MKSNQPIDQALTHNGPNGSCSPQREREIRVSRREQRPRGRSAGSDPSDTLSSQRLFRFGFSGCQMNERKGWGSNFWREQDAVEIAHWAACLKRQRPQIQSAHHPLSPQGKCSATGATSRRLQPFNSPRNCTRFKSISNDAPKTSKCFGERGGESLSRACGVNTQTQAGYSDRYGMHSFDRICDSHACSACGWIYESHHPYRYQLNEWVKWVECPRCLAKEKLIFSPVEYERWLRRRGNLC